MMKSFYSVSCIVIIVAFHMCLILLIFREFAIEFVNLRTHVFATNDPDDPQYSNTFDLQCSPQQNYPWDSSFSNQDTEATEVQRPYSLFPWTSQTDFSFVSTYGAWSDNTLCKSPPMSASMIYSFPRVRFNVDFRQCEGALSPWLPKVNPVASMDTSVSLSDMIGRNFLSIDMSMASVLCALAVNMRILSLNDLVEDFDDPGKRWLLRKLYSMGRIDRDTLMSTASYYDERYPAMSNIICTSNRMYMGHDSQASCLLPMNNVLVYPVLVGVDNDDEPDKFLKSALPCITSLLSNLYDNKVNNCDFGYFRIAFIYYPLGSLPFDDNLETSGSSVQYYSSKNEYGSGDNSYEFGQGFVVDRNSEDNSMTPKGEGKTQNANDDYSYYYNESFAQADEELSSAAPFWNDNEYGIYYEDDKYSSYWYGDDDSNEQPLQFDYLTQISTDSGKIFSFGKILSQNMADMQNIIATLSLLFHKAVMEEEKSDKKYDDVRVFAYSDLFRSLCPGRRNLLDDDLFSPGAEYEEAPSGCAVMTLQMNIPWGVTKHDENFNDNHPAFGLSSFDQSDYNFPQKSIFANEDASSIVYICRLSMWDAIVQAWAATVSLDVYLLFIGFIANFFVGFLVCKQFFSETTEFPTYEMESSRLLQV